MSTPSVTFPTQTWIDSLVSPYLKDNDEVGFAIGVASPQVTPASTVFYAGQLVSHQGDPIKLDGDTLFELASVSKTFAATLFASYASQRTDFGDTKIAPYHPPQTPPLSSVLDGITLLTLANYTSGLPTDDKDAHDHGPLHGPYNNTKMYDYLSGVTWMLPWAGQVYAYSNLGFALLAETMSLIVDPSKSYAQLLAQEITSPLGMNHTAMFADTDRQRLPRGFNAQQQRVRAGWGVFPAYFGAGGVVSTPTDVMTWLQYNMGMTTSPLATLLASTQQPSTSVTTKRGSQLGLGWFLTTITGSNGSLQTVWKDGGLRGFRSFVTFLQSSDPGSAASQAGVFVLTNSAAPSAAIARAILKQMTGNDATVEDDSDIPPE